MPSERSRGCGLDAIFHLKITTKDHPGPHDSVPILCGAQMLVQGPYREPRHSRGELHCQGWCRIIRMSIDGMMADEQCPNMG